MAMGPAFVTMVSKAPSVSSAPTPTDTDLGVTKVSGVSKAPFHGLSLILCMLTMWSGVLWILFVVCHCHSMHFFKVLLLKL